MADSKRQQVVAVAVVAIAAVIFVFVHGVLWDVARYAYGSFMKDEANLVTIGTSKAPVFRISLTCDRS